MEHFHKYLHMVGISEINFLEQRSLDIVKLRKLLEGRDYTTNVALYKVQAGLAMGEN